ncbi:type VI secretion system protein TssA [Amaricoccus sp.]|uniref:type VI secretion system protein TssA n=1 Tax=Amaricoccus sp. TaxID=1872485 RepID=UPI0025C60869|nr:type VI secretion system protein TssA [Amaricoccus sp.]
MSPWLAPLDGANPSGENLRNDHRFHELERLMERRVEVVRDDRNAAVGQTELPVDWAEVLRRAEALRGQGRDLRLLVIVARALANERGLAGLADGLTLIARNVDEHWDTMHPDLREGMAPREAALRRINALAQLENEQDGLLGDLAAAAWLSPRGIGPVTGRDLERGMLDARAILAEAPGGLSEAERGRIAAEQDQLISRVRSACLAAADEAPEALAALRAEAVAAGAALGEVQKSLAARIGEGDVTPRLTRFLSRLTATVAHDRGGPAAVAAAAPGSPEAAVATAAPAAGAAAAAGPIPDRLGSRDEVMRCLDLVIAFYDRTEPASPIPHLVRRVRRMVPMDFMQLMEELAPAGLKEFKLLAGVDEKKKAQS